MWARSLVLPASLSLLCACARRTGSSRLANRQPRPEQRWERGLCIEADGIHELLLAAAAEFAGNRIRCPAPVTLSWTQWPRLNGLPIQGLPLGAWQALLTRLGVRPARRIAAWMAGIQWLARRIESAGPGELSDLVQAFSILARAGPTAGLRTLGRRLALRSLRRYLALEPTLRADPIEPLFDAVSVVVYARQMRLAGSEYRSFEASVRRVWTRARPGDLLRSDEGPWRGRANRILDLLVDLYFPYVLGWRLPVPYCAVLREALAYPYGSRAVSDDDTYLATHLVYVLSDFGMRHPSRPPPGRLVRYLRRAERLYRKNEDPETLGEVCEVLGILQMARQKCVSFLLDHQAPSGAWTGPDVEGYTAYHTTWAALFGILDFRRSQARALCK